MKSTARVTYRYLYARLIQAMSMSEAKAVLGFPPEVDPSEREITKAWRAKAFENHPDRGGDPAKMVEINVAKDVLTGKQRATGEAGGYTPDPTYTPWTPPSRPKPEPVVVSWEDAKTKAGVPSAEWLFKTDTRYGGYGDSRSSGYVICGKSGEAYVYVAVEYYRSQNAFTGEDVSIYWMKMERTPEGISTAAPRIIRQLFTSFPNLEKKYNAKVLILPEGTSFDDAQRATGRSVSFKQALGLMKETAEPETEGGDPWANAPKIEVKALYYRAPFGKQPPGYHRENTYDDAFKLSLIINGREVPLSLPAMERLSKLRFKGKSFLDWAYPKYRETGQTAVLTKKQGFQPVLEWMVAKLPLDDAVKAALTKAANPPAATGGGGRRRRW